MRILFDNYVTLTSSESSYFNGVLRQAGVDSLFWSDKRISAFDILDSTKPDLFVTHYRQLTQDLTKYLSNNSKIDLVLNISGSTSTEVSALEDFLSTNKIKCSLMFSGDIDGAKSSKIKCEEILPGADLFFPVIPPGQRKIDFGVVCQSSKNDLVSNFVKDKDVYHLLGVNQEEVSDTDMQVNVKSVNDISHIYNTMVLMGDIRFVASQLFFDLLLRANKCSVVTNPNSEEKWNKFINRIFDTPKDWKSDDSMKELLRSQVLQKHTCYNRAERLMKFVGNSEAMSNVQKLRNNLHNGIGF